MESGLVEFQVLQMAVVQELVMLPVASTAECVGESSAISLEVQMLLVFKQFDGSTHITSMESVSLTEYLIIISGPMLLVYRKEAIRVNEITVHVATLVILVTYTPHRLLEITTTVNQATLPLDLFEVSCTLPIDSGMGSSVKASVAAMGNLLHGSAWCYPIQRLMILRCASAVQYQLMITLQYNCWNCTSSNEKGKTMNSEQ